MCLENVYRPKDDVTGKRQFRKMVIADAFACVNVTAWRDHVKKFDDIAIGEVQCFLFSAHS
jgi:hypothetical protein